MIKEEEVMAENQTDAPVEETVAPVVDPRVERLKKRYPEREYASEDEIGSTMLEAMDEDEKFRNETTEANQKLVDVLSEEPALLNIIRDVSKGASVPEAISRHIDLDEIKPMDGDPDFEAWTANGENRRKSNEERSSKQKAYEQNIDASMEEISQFATESGMDEASVSELLNLLTEFVDDIANGKVNKANLTKFKKMRDYDTDLASQTEAAKIAGRNEKIEVMRDKEASKTGDGLPRIADGGGEMEKKKSIKDSWSESIDRQQKKHNKF